MRRWFSVRFYAARFLGFPERVFASMPHRGEFDEIIFLARNCGCLLWDMGSQDLVGIQQDPATGGLSGYAVVEKADPTTNSPPTAITQIDQVLFNGVPMRNQFSGPIFRLSLEPPLTEDGTHNG
jgi:hypothetical protein